MNKTFSPGQIGLNLLSKMPQLTLARIGEEAMSNAHKNKPLLDKGVSIKALKGASLGRENKAIVVAAGPSLRKTNIAAKIKSTGFDGAIIAADSAMLYCLENGIVPDLVVTVDPHPDRIVRWFGNPELTESDVASDDYFKRQDMDPAFSDELSANTKTLKLLDQYGSKMRIALSSSSSPAVVKRAIDMGMEIFWWNPMYDDPSLPNSLTKKVFDLNGLPCINAGGNVGAACWMMADAVLEKQFVAVTGMDFSYYDETPYKNTQYYYEAVDLVGEENLDALYIRIFNPHLKKWFYTDPAYFWYRENFLEMIADANCSTYNCTEGGILFGEGITFAPIAKFVENTSS
jgi:hypothetical protein